MSGKVVKTVGYAVPQGNAPLVPFHYESKPMGPKDVHIQVHFAGICHSDIHKGKEEWRKMEFPMVPGHEIAGVVVDFGSEVTKFKKGDRVGVGCMVESCRDCRECKSDLENYCAKKVLTYAHRYPDGRPTYGGYGRDVVVDEHFVCRIPDSLTLDVAAPLLCAGITTYSPIRHFGFDKPGKKVGVIGLGGLGHMAVQFLKAFGAEVTVVSRSYAKKEEALSLLKVDKFLALEDAAAMEGARGTLEGIIDTVGSAKDMGLLLSLLDIDGKLITVGAPPSQLKISPFALIMERKMMAGSGIGGMKETQEMLDFSAANNIKCIVEKIPMSYVNEAWARVVKGDVRYRFVIDVLNTAPVVEA